MREVGRRQWRQLPRVVHQREKKENFPEFDRPRRSSGWSRREGAEECPGWLRGCFSSLVDQGSLICTYRGTPPSVT